jgi:hypothetical protein
VDQDEWDRLKRQPDLMEVRLATSTNVDSDTATRFLLANRAANDRWKELNCNAVLAAVGRRLSEEQGLHFGFYRADGSRIWPPEESEVDLPPTSPR